MSNITSKQVAFYIINAIKPFPLSIFSMVMAAVIWAIDLSLRAYLLKVILNRLCNQQLSCKNKMKMKKFIREILDI